MTTTMNKQMVIVPGSWVIYELNEGENIETLEQARQIIGQQQGPSVAIMEALVAVGRAKRVAAIHTLNTLPDDGEDEEGDSPFNTEDD